MLWLYNKPEHHVVYSMQVCRDLLQKGARELYEGYRAYALKAPLPWMQAIDAGAVRQVPSFFLL